ncbi:MAG: hypothetical protein VR66_09820, partial [Peptococcaceae bacterium BRH_c23]
VVPLPYNVLPTGLRDPRKFPFVSQLPEANPANSEFPHVSMGTSTKLATVMRTYCEFLSPVLADNH